MLRFLLACIFLSLVSTTVATADSKQTEHYWPQWRGPLATGVSPVADPPIEWSESKNIAWKVEIPGKGSASPIVWDRTIFVLTAVPVGDPAEARADAQKTPDRAGPRGLQPTRVQQFTIIALERENGQVRWRRVLREQLPHEGTHVTGTWASPSPMTDGERVYAFFGSYGLYCLDMDGDLLWEKDLGDMQTRRAFGEGSSPYLYDDKIVVNWDHEGPSFVVVLDKHTGQEIWRRDRDEITSWSTPLVVDHAGQRQVIISATGRVRSYDLDTGEVIWEAAGMTVNVIPSPVFSNGIVHVASGFRGSALLAIRLAGARGDITDSENIVWSLDRDTPYTPSPLLYGEHLYLLKTNDGILSAYKAKTGEKIFGPVRLEKVPNIYASPVGAAERIYIAGRDGVTMVIAKTTEFEVLAVNELDDGFDASPALVDREVYLRGKRYLYRISKN